MTTTHETLTARTARLSRSMDHIERFAPEAHAKIVAELNDSVPLLRLITSGYVRSLTEEGRLAIDELESAIAEAFPAADRLVLARDTILIAAQRDDLSRRIVISGASYLGASTSDLRYACLVLARAGWTFSTACQAAS